MAAPIITVAEAKAWLRVDHADDDETIIALCQVASDAALDLADGLPEAVPPDPAPPVPERVKQAALLILASLYANRESGDLPKAARTLADPYRNWSAF
jgi:hypothetical protein